MRSCVDARAWARVCVYRRVELPGRLGVGQAQPQRVEPPRSCSNTTHSRWLQPVARRRTARRHAAQHVATVGPAEARRASVPPGRYGRYGAVRPTGQIKPLKARMRGGSHPGVGSGSDGYGSEPSIDRSVLLRGEPGAECEPEAIGSDIDEPGRESDPNDLRRRATPCDAVESQRYATLCNTLQHNATRCSVMLQRMVGPGSDTDEPASKMGLERAPAPHGERTVSRRCSVRRRTVRTGCKLTRSCARPQTRAHTHAHALTHTFRTTSRRQRLQLCVG